MPTYRITFIGGRCEDVPGDDNGVEGSGAIVVYRDVLVIGRPRRIVAARYAASDGVKAVDLLESAGD